MKKLFFIILICFMTLDLYAQNVILKNPELIKIYTKDGESFSLCDDFYKVKDLLGIPENIKVEAKYTGDKDCYNLETVYYSGIKFSHYKGFNKIIGITILNNNYSITDLEIMVNKSKINDVLEVYKELQVARNELNKDESDKIYKTIAFRTVPYRYGPLYMIYFDFDNETNECIAIKLICTEE